MWRRLWQLLAAVLVAATSWTALAAPFPAHLVLHNGQGALHRPVSWQEYPVALNPLNGSADFKPILAGTDHGLYNEGFFEGDIVRSTKHQPGDPDTKNAVTDPNLLWPFGAVAYKVDDDVGCPESPQCAILMAAMDHYHENSCIRFKQWTGEDNWVTIFFNSDSSGACWSPVGRVADGEQRLSLGQRCWYKGIVIHELGHAIGFWHEMNRPDRDDWIYVYWQNIVPGFASAFRKHERVATLGENFDYRSIMMYDEYAFSKDGRSPTLQATTGEEIGPIWRKKGLSASDRRRVEKLYKCDPTKPKPGFPYNVNCDFNRHVCGFKNGGSPNWNWRTVNQTDGYVYTSFDTAGSTPGHFVSINFPPMSAAQKSVRGELGCVRFYYLIETDGEARLILDQAYLKRVTQLTHDEEATFELWSNDTSANEWIHMEIPLYVTRPFKLIFTSTFNGSATHGTIALDDVELLYSPCSPQAAAGNASVTELPGSPRPTTTTTTTEPTEPTEPTTPTPDGPPTGAETDPSPTSTTAQVDGEAPPSSSAPSKPPPTEAPTTVPSMTTAGTEEAIQQLQLQQQQEILHVQQLLEKEQQKEQQQLLLAMAHDLQQSVAQLQQLQHHKHGEQSHEQSTPPTATDATTFPTYQTVATVSSVDGGGPSTPFTFPISLNESYDVGSSPAKIPNLPNPTDRIPMKNPHPRPPTSTTMTPSSSTSYYDVDESLPG